jgi:hypothetical protein
VGFNQQKIPFELILEDEDGQTVTQASEQGVEPVQFGGQFEVGRPPGLRPGRPIDLPLAVVVQPLSLQPAHRYTWRIRINDKSEDDWFLAFDTRA